MDQGTDLSPENKGHSDKYAAQMNLPKYKHVLHPKALPRPHIVEFGLAWTFSGSDRGKVEISTKLAPFCEMLRVVGAILA